jgi:hypothetical protein
MAKNKKKQSAPRGEHRILFVSDPSSLTAHYFPDPVEEIDLRRLIGIMADSGVDMYCQDVYSQCCTAYWRSGNYPYDQRPQHQRYLPLLDAGVQPAGVLLDECHKRDMLFLAGFRVNDGHGYKNLSKAAGIKVAIEDAIRENPDWELTDLPGGQVAGNDFNAPYYLDFSSEGVRDYTTGVIKEVIETFDVDGVELCFRDVAYFPVGTGRQRAELMTDIFRQVRVALDKKSRETGKNLLFGARVCSPIDELLDLGLDVKTWVAEGLLDYISPQDSMWVDFNFALPEFGELTAGSKCLLYPGLNPWSSQRARIQFGARPIDFDTARAYAHSCYQNGADGISPFNHCTVSRTTPFYPQSLQIFYQLADPEQVASGMRHYKFDSLLAGFTAYYDREGRAVEPIKSDKILLDRSQNEPAGDYELNLFENSDSVRNVNLLFRGFNMTDVDELEIQFNGHVIDNDIIGRTRISNYDPEKDKDESAEGALLSRSSDRSTLREYKGRLITCVPEMGRFSNPTDPRVKEIPPHSTAWFPLDPSKLLYGKNSLSVKLANSDPQATEPIVIEEVEIFVMPE